MKLGICNYVAGSYDHTCKSSCCDNVSGLGHSGCEPQYVTFCVFLFTLFLGSCQSRTGGPTLMINMSRDMFPHEEAFSESPWNCSPFRRSNHPKTSFGREQAFSSL